ncbi:MAG TPA: hypothetical protein VNK23_12130 [Candidatus Dormibacteraeota bacterium]|nr:hypothetical protein [Candidatus Dormibacteraeota bacterium]
MSSIPGPVIRFLIDQPGLAQAINPAMQQVKQQAQAASRSVAESWRATAAQIRADMARGTLSTRELANAQRDLVSSLQGQLSSLRQRSEISTKELGNMKAMTLELERQKNALKTGAGIGITRGTEHALSQVGTQNMLGMTRMLDALVNRYFGGAAGAAVRTLRDTAYYSSMAGQAGAESGGKTSLLGKLFTPTGLGVAAGVGGVLAGTAAITKMGLAGGKLAEELTNTATKTGMTVENLIKLRSASDILGVNFDRVQTGFRKFSQEITFATAATLPNASQKAKEAAAIFKVLGVDVKKAAADPFSAIQQLSLALSKLPDGAVKTATAVQLFGRGGMELLPVLNNLQGSIRGLGGVIHDLSASVGGATGSEIAMKQQTEKFRLELEKLEVSLSHGVIPALTAMVGWANDAGRIIKATFVPLVELLEGHPGKTSAAKPQSRALNLGGFLNYTQASGDTAKTQADLARIESTTGKAAKDAAGRVKKLREEFLKFHKAFTAGHAPNVGGIPGSRNPELLGGGTLEDAVKAARKTANEIAKQNKALVDAQNKAAEEIQRQMEHYKRKADSLFGDLLSGNTKSFSGKFESDVETIVTKRFRDNFDKTIGGLLQNLDQSINGKSGGSSSGGGIGGIFGKIFGINLGPGGTPGTFSGPLGLGGPGGKSTVAIQAGQTGVTTQVMYVNAGSVTIGGAASSGHGGGSFGIPGAGGSGFLGGAGGGFGTFFGNLNPFGGGNSFFGNLSPFGGRTSAGGGATSGGLGGIFGGGAGQILGGLLVGGLGASHGSVTSEALGASGTAQGLVKALVATGHISPALAGKLIPGLGGAGLVASGLAEGGGAGVLSDVAGGAQIGGAVGGPVGAAIGAAVGAIAGGIRAIFGGDSWSRKVVNAMNRQAIYLPPSESFSFASNGSIANTLQTGFGMSGNRGSTYALPSGTPFWANPIYGPLNNYQKGQLNQWEYGLNPNEPFFGAGASGNNPGNPFVGNFNGWHGRAFPTQPAVQIHLNLPGYVDANSAEAALGPIKEKLSQLVASTFHQNSSGMAYMTRRVTDLP